MRAWRAPPCVSPGPSTPRRRSSPHKRACMSSTSSCASFAVRRGPVFRDVELTHRLAEAVVEHLRFRASSARAARGRRSACGRRSRNARRRTPWGGRCAWSLMKRKVRYSFHVPSGTSAIRLPAAATALGVDTSTRFAEPRPIELSVAVQSNCGASFISCARVIGLWVLTGSRSCSGVHWSFASRVSSAMIRSARPSGIGQAGERRQIDDIFAVGGADLVVLVAFQKVIIARRQAQAGLARRRPCSGSGRPGRC